MEQSKPEMSATELAARISELEAALPQAPEPECEPLFRPGVICFRDGQYSAVSPSVDLVWPLIQDHIARLLEQIQVTSGLRHNLQYWRGRFEKGCAIALAFSNPEGTQVTDAGIINLELAGDGKPMVGMMVYTVRDLDLQHAARIAEAIALRFGAERVMVWAPVNVPPIPGYTIEHASYGQLQLKEIQ